MEFPRHLVESTFKSIIKGTERKRAGGNKVVLNGFCPICNDTCRNKNRKRFFLYEKKGMLVVFCHNCNYSRSFSNFLKEKYPDKYDNLRFSAFDSLTSNTLFTKKAEEAIVEKLPSQTLHDYLESYFNSSCVKLSDIQTNDQKEKLRKYAVSILEKRMIPEKFWKNYFVCFTGTFQWRIILPFVNDKGLYYNFQARDVHPRPSAERKNKKYIFASFMDIEMPDDKIFNKYLVDASKTVYILEGIFKSLFVPNSIALCNANVTGSRADEVRKIYPKRVWILDSPWKDNTGFQATLKLLSMGETCFIMPKEHADCKDMDELAQKLKVTEFTEEFINSNTLTGQVGMVKLKMYKMMSESV